MWSNEKQMFPPRNNWNAVGREAGRGGGGRPCHGLQAAIVTLPPPATQINIVKIQRLDQQEYFDNVLPPLLQFEYQETAPED